MIGVITMHTDSEMGMGGEGGGAPRNSTEIRSSAPLTAEVPRANLLTFLCFSFCTWKIEI